MTKNILLSLAASFALIIAFALPVDAAQTVHHNQTAATHHEQAKHAEYAQYGHTRKSELEARTKAPHLQDNKVMYRVNASKLYERSGPGVSHKSVGTLRHGTLVEVKELSHDGKWALVHTGTWVSTKYLEKNSEKHQGISHLGELTPEYHAKYGTSAATHGMYSSHAIHAIHSTHIANGGNAKHAIGY